MALLQAPYCLRHGWVGFYLRGVLLLARAGCSPCLHCSTVILDSPLSVLMYSTSFVDETFHCRGSWANLWMSIGFRVPLISHHTPTPPIFVTCNRVVVMLAECYTGTSVVCWHGALKLSLGSTGTRVFDQHSAIIQIALIETETEFQPTNHVPEHVWSQRYQLLFGRTI